MQEIEVEIVISLEEERMADIFLNCLSVEARSEKSFQEKVNIIMSNPMTVKISFSSTNLSRIRAITNSYLRMIMIIYNIYKMLDSYIDERVGKH